MVKTGYISFITETGGGKDSDGNPTASTPTSSAFVKCNLKVITKQYLVLVEGQYQQAKYSCYIDTADVPTGLDLQTVKKITLQDSQANELGEFQVQNLEYLDITKRVKLVV